MKKNILHLSNFEGPLDLLLHLISENEIDIYDIPIVEITTQYLDFIYNYNDLDIDEASEFVVMASTLLEIKSRMLLPKPEEEDGIEEDPREELVRRLIEYKAFRELSAQLKEKETLYNRTLTKDPEYFSEIKDEYTVDEISLSLLSKAIRTVMSRQDTRQTELMKNQTIETESYSVDDCMLEITRRLEKQKEFDFFSLFAKNHQRGYVIATFLAILELLKLNAVELYQEKTYDNIIIKGI